MRLISEVEMESLISSLHLVLDKATIMEVADQKTGKFLDYHLFLKQFSSRILENSTYTYEEILYSQYYWFIQFKNHYFIKEGYDAGIDQMAFDLQVQLIDSLNDKVDWNQLEEITKL